MHGKIMLLCASNQGILAELEEQIKSLQEQLDSRESVVAEQIGSLEASNQTSALRIGNSCMI